MALRPGATGMFLCAVDDGVTRRKGTAGRLITTAWVAVGRIARGSEGAPEGACEPGDPPERPAPGPGRVCTPGRGGIPPRPWAPGCEPCRGPPPERSPPGPDPGRTDGPEPGRAPCGGGLEMICA